MFYNLLAKPFYDVAEPVVKYLTVAVVAAALVCGLVIFLAKRKRFGTFLKLAAVILVAYALIIGGTMLIANLIKRTDPAYLDKNYLNKDVITYVLVPIITAVGLTLVSGVVLFILAYKKVSKKTLTITAAVLGGLCACAFIAACVTVSVYYTRHIKGNGYYEDWIDWNTGEVIHNKVNRLALYISAAVLAGSMIAAAFLLGRKKSEFNSRCIALAGVCVALSFALSYVKLFRMPQGGSITLVSLLPVMLFAYIYGPKRGLLVGFIYGTLQAVQDPYIIHPAQFLLDYPVAFAAVGFAGVFKDVKGLEKVPQVKFVLGAVVAGMLRYISHVLSGTFAFSAYALDSGTDKFLLYSLLYNTYVLIDVTMVIAAGAMIFSSRSFVKALERYTFEKETPPDTSEEQQ